MGLAPLSGGRLLCGSALSTISTTISIGHSLMFHRIRRRTGPQRRRLFVRLLKFPDLDHPVASTYATRLRIWRGDSHVLVVTKRVCHPRDRRVCGCPQLPPNLSAWAVARLGAVELLRTCRPRDRGGCTGRDRMLYSSGSPGARTPYLVPTTLEEAPKVTRHRALLVEGIRPAGLGTSRASTR